MTNYIISIKTGSRKGERFMVSASSVEDAAQKAMPRIVKRAKAIRVTGQPGMTGVFQGYKKQGTSVSSVGPNFNVMG